MIFEKPFGPYNMQHTIFIFYLCTVWDLTHSLRASGLAATLLILDIGMLVLNRYILLGNTHTHTQACRNLQRPPFFRKGSEAKRLVSC